MYDASFSMPVCIYIWLMHFDLWRFNHIESAHRRRKVSPNWRHEDESNTQRIKIWFSSNWIYDVSFSMPVCIHTYARFHLVCPFSFSMPVFNDIMLRRNVWCCMMYDALVFAIEWHTMSQVTSAAHVAQTNIATDWIAPLSSHLLSLIIHICQCSPSAH